MLDNIELKMVNWLPKIQLANMNLDKIRGSLINFRLIYYVYDERASRQKTVILYFFVLVV